MSTARPPEGACPLRLRRGVGGVPEKRPQPFLGVAGVAQHDVRSLGEVVQ